MARVRGRKEMHRDPLHWESFAAERFGHALRRERERERERSKRGGDRGGGSERRSRRDPLHWEPFASKCCGHALLEYLALMVQGLGFSV